uniref:Cytochrome P450, family 1, subfamily C, polypeptide 1 n=1 Tax=Oreochromis niloticus TaxID=8128 RepID=I3KYY7_ORENI
MALDTEFGVKSSSSIIREWSGQVHPALVATFVFLFCVEACLWVRNLRLKRRLPGPFAWPVVGNAMQLGQMPHITFARLAKKYGNVYQIRLGCSDVVVLNGERAIRQALIQHSTEFAGRPNFLSFQMISGGRSLTFTNYSKQWKAHRKVAQSSLRAFSSANSHTKKAFEQHVTAEAMELVQALLRQSTDRRYSDLVHEFTVASANIMCALCFGRRYGHDDLEFRTLLKRMDKFGETVGAGSLVDVMPWLQSFPNPVRSVYENFKNINEEFFGFVKDKVMQHRESFNPQVTRDMSDAIISVIEHGEDSRLTKEFVEATVTDLIGAGQDTISTFMQWILLLLVKYPDVQAKLQELIDKVVGRDRLPSIEDRSSLAYLDAFIYETMRFISFVPLTIPHSTTSDVTIEGLHIPKDTVVFINQWSVNHDPLKWKDPHVFDPSRFLDESGALDKDKANSVMIFSTGKRRCIGNQIAKEFQFKLFHYLLYSQKEQNKQSVLIKGDKNDMFMKLGSRAGVFHQEAYVPFSKDEEDAAVENELHKLHGPRFNFYCTSTPALPMPNACLPSTMKHMCSKFA